MQLRPRSSCHLPARCRHFQSSHRLPKACSHLTNFPYTTSITGSRQISLFSPSTQPAFSLQGGIWPAEEDIRRATAGRAGTVDDHPSALSHCVKFPEADAYGRWKHLLWDVEQLEREANLGVAAPSHNLVDQPGNENDLALWSCLLNFARRRNGDAGVAKIWKAVSARRRLHDIGQSLGAYFWETILQSASTNEDFLESIYSYAGWLYRTHHVEWPFLYQRVVSNFLSIGQFDMALRWHLRICATLEPKKAAVETLLRHFILDTNPAMQSALRSIYITNTHRQLYDALVPHLSSNRPSLELAWRTLLASHGDIPTLSTSEVWEASRRARPSVILESKFSGPELAAPQTQCDAVIFPSTSPASSETFPKDRNGAYDATSYNDALGARWFATSWMSVDFAMRSIHTLGIREIGPLSLQSICLRKPNTSTTSLRLAQLESYGIGIGVSSFSRAVQFFASKGYDASLRNLLSGDLHPEVFDDFPTQEDILADATSAGWWDRHQVIYAVRLALNRIEAMPPRNFKSGTAMDVQADHSILHLSRAARADLAIELQRHGLSSVRQIPTDMLRSLMFELASSGNLYDLEQCFFEILGLCQVPSEKETCPEISEILTTPLQMHIVQCAFYWEFRAKTRDLSALGGNRTSSEKFSIARGVRLLRMLQDHGVAVDLDSIKQAVATSLVDLDAWTASGDGVESHRLRRINVLRLIGDAWEDARPFIMEQMKGVKKQFARFARN